MNLHAATPLMTGGHRPQQEGTTMNKDVFDEWRKLGKDAFEPMMRLNEITVRGMERVARQQLDVARDYLDLGTKQATVMNGAESPEDMLSEQTKLVSEFGERMINRAQEFAKIAAETQQAVAQWAQKSTKRAEESAKKVQESVNKAQEPAKKSTRSATGS
jgi:phasin family protein